MRAGTRRVRTGQPMADPRLRGYTPVDLVAGTYLILTSVVLIAGHAHIPSWEILLILHLVVLVGIGLLRFAPRGGWLPLQFLRDAYGLLSLPLIYKEVGLLNRGISQGYFDEIVLRWDRFFFGSHPNATLSQSFPSPVLGEFLHFCYLFYILLIPVLGLTLYFQRRYQAFRVFATTVMATSCTCYLIFIFFPVQGPYYTFPRPPIEDFGIFPPLVHGMLARGAAVGAAFPSSHVAAAVAVAMMAWRFSRKLFSVLTVLAMGIAAGTVYGGFHYAVDAVAGLLLGLVMAVLGPRLHSFLLRRTRLYGIPLRFPHLRFVWREGRYQGELHRDKS